MTCVLIFYESQLKTTLLELETLRHGQWGISVLSWEQLTFSYCDANGHLILRETGYGKYCTRAVATSIIRVRGRRPKHLGGVYQLIHMAHHSAQLLQSLHAKAEKASNNTINE